MRRLSLRSPAKLNLFLNVTQKRHDGYHNLTTLFERIDLCDVIHLQPNRTGKICLHADHPGLCSTKQNLATRAAVLLKDRYRIPHGADIHLVKNIPVAAGLGGGSSNAAAVLMGLNRLWKLNRSLAELSACGRELGSDVPFFLYGCRWAVGRRRGDQIKPVAIKPRLWHVLIVPCLKIYSREVFTALNLQLTKRTGNVNILIRSLQYNNINNVQRLLSNDLESGIFTTCPKLLKIKNRISRITGRPVAFSGSGPSMFVITQGPKEAAGIHQALERLYRRVYIVKTA